ncbi:MAG: stage sporulation protein, partial [Oscillospiraceae bacterium]|nr:stage sporulation protein [Oscillospiraceae bacterium]
VTDNTFKIGLWVRDSSAGIGTVTFYNPENSVFGGLGHAVCDVDTGQVMPIMSGEVVDVNINGVTRGSSGSPGELKGSFSSNKDSGSIAVNNETGVFGVLYQNPSNHSAIPIAMKQEVKTGKATIFTTVSGNTPQEYKINIEKVNLNDNSMTKNMVIKITDPELLQKTGGIVQGMSGSPIMQNGVLVGAVTHVFINDPTKGYGIFIENMYNHSKAVKTYYKKIAS